MIKSRGIRVVLLALAFSIPCSCIITWFLNVGSNRLIKQWQQPKEINYKSFDPYYAGTK
jgi:hypothetical protein